MTAYPPSALSALIRPFQTPHFARACEIIKNNRYSAELFYYVLFLMHSARLRCMLKQ